MKNESAAILTQGERTCDNEAKSHAVLLDFPVGPIPVAILPQETQDQ
jgi:hypothetical protein